MRVKRRGLNSYCFQLDLLSLRQHKLGRDALERLFFGDIDSRGAKARDILADKGASALNGDQRVEFARLLLSLEARRPAIVGKLRLAGDQWAKMLDTDPEVLAVAKGIGLAEKPSQFYERHTGTFLEDHALTVIQKLVDNPRVGGQLINAAWEVFRFKDSDATLILSDRPLIRLFGYDHENAIWVLPLNPRAVFVAANRPANIAKLNGVSSNRLAKQINVSSANQTERFAFSIANSHGEWLSKYLRPR